MNILLTGANGFIGRYLLAGLLSAGHRVIPAVRRPAETDRLLPSPLSIAVDFNTDTSPDDWAPRLANIDAVINCSGILQGRPGQSIEAIHAAAPKALFAACEKAGVKRVIQISAISAEAGADTAYATTKIEADRYLMTTDLDWIVVRPSLVYAEGAYGGTALFRAFAALPFIIPVVGKGEQLFQPIHVDDVTETILKLLNDSSIRHMVIDPVGPEQLSMRQVLIDLRRWLGFPAARVIEVPLPLIKLVSRIGDFIGGTINTTALRQLTFGNTGDVGRFIKSVGIEPRRWYTALLAHPAQTADRWHARLYFLRPLLRWSLAGMWLISGIIGFAQLPQVAEAPLAALGITGHAAKISIWSSCLLDMAIGILLFARWRPNVIGVIQLMVVIAYTVGLSIAQPALWMDPFGPLLKNLPIMATILALAAVEQDR